MGCGLWVVGCGLSEDGASPPWDPHPSSLGGYPWAGVKEGPVQPPPSPRPKMAISGCRNTRSWSHSPFQVLHWDRNRRNRSPNGASRGPNGHWRAKTTSAGAFGLLWGWKPPNLGVGTRRKCPQSQDPVRLAQDAANFGFGTAGHKPDLSGSK